MSRLMLAIVLLLPVLLLAALPIMHAVESWLESDAEAAARGGETAHSPDRDDDRQLSAATR